MAKCCMWYLLLVIRTGWSNSCTVEANERVSKGVTKSEKMGLRRASESLAKRKNSEEAEEENGNLGRLKTVDKMYMGSNGVY